MAEEFGHKRLAKAHDFGVRLAVRVEIGAALAAADREAGEGVLKDLLEAKKLHDAEVDAAVEAQSPFVGAQCRVELDAKAAVDPHLALIVNPGDAEDDLPFRFGDALEDRGFGVFGAPSVEQFERFEHLSDRLVEFAFAGIAAQNGVKGRIK